MESFIIPPGHLLPVALVSGVSAQHRVCSMSDGEHTIVSHQPYYPSVSPAGSLVFCSCPAFWEEDRWLVKDSLGIIMYNLPQLPSPGSAILKSSLYVRLEG